MGGGRVGMGMGGGRVGMGMRGGRVGMGRGSLRNFLTRMKSVST